MIVEMRELILWIMLVGVALLGLSRVVANTNTADKQIISGIDSSSASTAIEVRTYIVFDE